MTTDSRIEALRQKTVANGATEPEARAAAAKVSELLAGAGPPVTLPADPRMTEREAEEVLSRLYALGYTLVNEQESRLFGRIRVSYVDSDDGIHHLVEHLKTVTPLRKLDSDAAGWFQRLTARRRIMLPERHPSGLTTQEAPHTTVSALGAGVHSPERSRPS